MQTVLATTIFLSAIGMFQFGFSATALNEPQTVVENFFIKSFKEREMGHLSRSAARTYFSIATSLFLVGGIFGALSSSWIANKFGRRNGLIYCQLISITGAILGVLCKPFNSFEMLMVSRLFAGFGSGVHTVIVPLYVSEISPIYMRGSAGVLCTLANTFGLLFAMVLGLKEILGHRKLWSIILGIPGIIGLFQFTFLPLMPKSPRYLLLTKGNIKEGTKALSRLRGTSRVDGELYEILNEEKLLTEHVENYGSFGDSNEHLIGEKSLSVYELLTSSKYYLSLFVCACVQISQQATGITVLLLYSTSFFQDAGLGCNVSRYATISIGAVLCLATFISVDLMERLGRRTLHVIIGMIGMLTFSAILNTTLAFENLNSSSNATSVECSSDPDHPGSSESFKISATGLIIVFSTIGFVIVFGVGPGPIAWLIPSEMFGQSTRAAASTFSIFCNWIAQLLVALLFPQMQVAMGNYSLIPFSILLFFLWFVLFMYFPETKNQSSAQISLLFQMPNAWKKPIGIRSVELLNALSNGRSMKDIENFSFTGSVY